MAIGRVNSKNQIISYENSIQKSREFSIAKLNQGLTLNQMQLLAFAIYSTQQNGATEFHKGDFEKKFGIEKYQTIHAKQDAQKVSSLQFSIEDLENHYFEYWNVFGSIKYKEGLFTFRWNEEFVPHILELKEKYITTDLTITSHFKSGFSWTLYDYLKAHYGYWHKQISKEALMRLFGVESKKTYRENTALFKKTVLDVAIAEINKYTELEIRYNVEKKGRAITAFDLIWSNGQKLTSATKKQINEIESFIDIVFKDMFEYINLDNETDRLRARDLILEIEDMRKFIDEPISITSERANELIQKAVWNFKQLNGLLEKNHKFVSPESVKKVEFYNWLEDKE
ncbi:replication initiation protein [Planococcus sp. ISL-110]|uniref:replication initiation protein n=1 Tax=Planococcus sp. ISL-110 TaxID=2819167 RepID=UPI001BEC7079|nr:replication initiation protein [Planococcus sp. ISL-110]MBT2572308.1 replication initiation protein [Planococcus sp. ISL-110]